MPVFRKQAILGAKETAWKAPEKEMKNVVIFGETGVGKSSLVNLIAGEGISETSSNASGCTLGYTRHLLKLGDQHFAIWDTAGLDEGSHGSVPAEKAEAYLKQLLHELLKTGGIDLLVYCVRATRVRSALLTNYRLFYSAICRRKVPIAIVITGLENQEGNMDTWWLKNQKQFSALQMSFNNYACVTTLESPMENEGLEERRRISKIGLIKMITTTCRTEQWTPAERSWVDTAICDIRSILSPCGAHGTQSHVTSVIICDIGRSAPTAGAIDKRSFTFHSPITLSLSTATWSKWTMSFHSPVSAANERSQSALPFDDAMKCTPERLFRVYQVPRRQTTWKDRLEERKVDLVLKRGADLLIFCVKKEDGDCRDVKLQWEHFNCTYAGDLSPQIVVVIGPPDQQSASEWWMNVVGGPIGNFGDTSIAYWPTDKSIAEVETARRQLRHLVNTCCIDCTKANSTGNKRIFSHRTSPGPSKSLPLWVKPTTLGHNKMDGSFNDPDVLTKWGVWQHISDER